MSLMNARLRKQIVSILVLMDSSIKIFPSKLKDIMRERFNPCFNG